MEPDIKAIGANIWKYTKKVTFSTGMFAWSLIVVLVMAIPAAWGQAVDTWNSIQ